MRANCAVAGVLGDNSAMTAGAAAHHNAARNIVDFGECRLHLRTNTPTAPNPSLDLDITDCDAKL